MTLLKVLKMLGFTHPNKKHKKWKISIGVELNAMDENNVWSMVDLKTLPETKKLLRTKWVFKVKEDGRYHYRLDALGNSQIPGVDFVDLYAPVLDDITLRIVINSWINNPNWNTQVIDMTCAFSSILPNPHDTFSPFPIEPCPCPFPMGMFQ